MFRFSVPCLMGVEGLVADELKFKGFQQVEAENGRVLFSGDEAECARANLLLRCGERVLLRLAEFTARSFDALFEGVRAIPWEDYIGSGEAFPVKGFSIHSQLHSVPDCQRIIKKAAVERLKMIYRTDWLKEDGVKHQIQFSLLNDRCEIFLDTTGAPLYKRGYKLEQNEATLRETLAASIVKVARWRGREDLIDPFCGSGTLAIEAAQAALNIARDRTGSLTPPTGTRPLPMPLPGSGKRPEPPRGTKSCPSLLRIKTPTASVSPGKTPPGPAWATAWNMPCRTRWTSTGAPAPA